MPRRVFLVFTLITWYGFLIAEIEIIETHEIILKLKAKDDDD